MTGLTTSIYNSAPVFMQNLAVTAFGLGWRQRRFGGVFQEELKRFKDREAFSEKQWNEYSTRKLQKLLKHAFETVPFYKEFFSKAGFDHTSFHDFQISDISRLPFLEKNELRKFGTSTLLSTIREKGGEFFPSSGSTGTPTQILFSYPMHQRWSAGFEARIRHWAGVDRFTSRGTIGGRRVVPDGNAKPPFYRYNFIEKQVYFSAYHISAGHAQNYLEGIKRYGLQYMTGYAMSNFFLARFFEELKLEVPPLKAVITSSEKLTDAMRETFQRVYQCKTFDSWSGLEACGLVSECEHGSLHISPDLGLIEMLDDQGNPVAPGEIGEVVCTGFVNYDQPLIRYRIGDLMRLGDKPCSCGRAMPVIKEIIGRVEDTVVGKDGREMVRFHGIFINLPNLIEAQIIQHTLDMFEIKIVTNGKWTSAEADTITKRMISQLGDIQLNIHEVATIPRNPSGKFPAVISNVKRST